MKRNLDRRETKRSLLYSVWNGMHDRCTNSYRDDFKHYGGRGIKVCARWATRERFVADMAPRPSMHHTLDRIDNDGNYEPGNVRWVTRTEQLRNQRRNRRLTFNGETRCITEWSEKTGISKSCIAGRISLGWSIERTLTTPVRPMRRYRA